MGSGQAGEDAESRGRGERDKREKLKRLKPGLQSSASSHKRHTARAAKSLLEEILLQNHLLEGQQKAAWRKVKTSGFDRFRFDSQRKDAQESTSRGGQKQGQ